MGKIVSKIVLTGGPCAGKTSALSKIEEELTEKGYKVFIVSESATEIIKGGIKPFGENPFDLVTFQSLILKYQYMKEKIYEEAANKTSEGTNCVIVYDRGLLDNKAYINQQIFNKLLSEQGLNELKIMDNYNMVIHLVTAADGAEEAYTLSNNAARTETIEEAKILDSRTVNAWAGHPNLKIIDNNRDFSSKLQTVVDEIYNLLGNPISIRKQKKFLVDLNNSDLSFFNEDNSTLINIEQNYINNNDEIETRIRKRTYQGQSCYYLTVQHKEKNGKATILSDKKISEKEYNKLLDSLESKIPIIKDRYSFTINKQYFRLDIFKQFENYAILEVDPTYDNSIIELPKKLRVIADVTDDVNYDNHIIAKNLKDKVLIR